MALKKLTYKDVFNMSIKGVRVTICPRKYLYGYSNNFKKSLAVNKGGKRA